MNYSWVTLLTNDIYIYGVITLVKGLRAVNTKYPISVIITPNISKPIVEILEKLHLNIIVKEKIKPQTEHQELEAMDFIGLNQPGFHAALTKFEIYNLTQFDKIVYIDSDIWIKQNFDEIFEYPNGAAINDLYGELPMFCSGLLVIEPNTDTFEQLIEFFNTKYVPRDNLIHDQDVLQQFFADWKDKFSLHIPIEYNLWSTFPDLNFAHNDWAKSYHIIDKKPWTMGKNYYYKFSDTYPEYVAVTTAYVDQLNEDMKEFSDTLLPISDEPMEKFLVKE